MPENFESALNNSNKVFLVPIIDNDRKTDKSTPSQTKISIIAVKSQTNVKTKS